MNKNYKNYKNSKLDDHNVSDGDHYSIKYSRNYQMLVFGRHFKKIR